MIIPSSPKMGLWDQSQCHVQAVIGSDPNALWESLAYVPTILTSWLYCFLTDKLKGNELTCERWHRSNFKVYIPLKKLGFHENYLSTSSIFAAGLYLIQ